MGARDTDSDKAAGPPDAAPVVAVTSGMVGHGFYNAHSAAQWAATEYVLPWLDDAVASMPPGDPASTLCLADFGCSEGRNSIAVMQRLVTAIRRRMDRPIQTVHSDLPTNDYAAVFRALRPGGRSVYGGPEIYSAAVGGSMYDQLLPPRSTHVATTFNAIGFLSRYVVDVLPHYILPNGPSARRNRGSVSDADRQVFAAQARDDIELFLRARAAELVPGGILLIQAFGSGEHYRTCDGIYDALNDAMLECVDAGLIDRGSYEAFVQPVYFRSLDELTASVTAPRASFDTLFRLERAESYEVPVPFVEAYKRTGDKSTYARAFTDFFRAFTEPVLRLAFTDVPHLDRLVFDIFLRAERLIREDPDRYEFHYVAVAMLLTRRGSGPPGQDQT